MKPSLTCLFLACLFFLTTSAQDGTIDPTFNPSDSGYFRGDGSEVSASLVLPDGKIILGGSFFTYNGSRQRGLVRVHPDGTLDVAFNAGGTGIEGGIGSLLLQPDGKIVVAGEFSKYNNIDRQHILRINADGSLDNTFSAPFIYTSSGISSIALQNDGKVVIGGSFSAVGGVNFCGLARLNADGSLDTTFAGRKFPCAGEIYKVGVQSTGKILVAGEFNEFNGVAVKNLLRLNSNGSMDTTFLMGTGPNAYVSSLHVRADDAFAIVGGFNQYNGVSRINLAMLNADGSLNTSFVTQPGVAASRLFTVTVNEGGQVLVAGLSNSISRFNADGSRDTAFKSPGVNGYIQYSGGMLGSDYNAVHSITEQADGKYIIGGHFTQYGDTVTNGILRIYPTGLRDQQFNRGSGSNNWIRASVVQGDGKIIIGGSFTAFNERTVNGIARLFPDGTLDTTFNKYGQGLKYYGSMGTIYAMALQHDGKILISGSFQDYNGLRVWGLARLLPDGNLDVFPVGPAAGSVSAITVQPDNKIMIGGSFRYYITDADNSIIRLNEDGSKDYGFTSPFKPGTYNEVSAIIRQPDGRYIITGSFELVSVSGIKHIARLLSNGSFDTSFKTTTPLDDLLYPVLQPDGKIIVVGSFYSPSDPAYINMLRLNADGSKDTTFRSMPPTSKFGTPLLLSDGKILVTVTGYFGGDTSRIIRLNPDGSLDESFHRGTGLSSSDNNYHTRGITPVLQRDGKIIVYGNFWAYNGIGRNRITRLNHSVSPSITTGLVVPLTYCAGGTLNIGFSAMGFSSSSVFTAQLSDATGSFSSPVNIGSVTGTMNGVITGTIPTSTPAGSAYRIRVVTSLPAITTADNGVNIIINAGASHPTWNGSFNTNWNDARNWCGGVPTYLTDATIPAATLNAPVIPSDALVKNFTIDSGAIVNVNTNSSLSLRGNLTINGTLAGSLKSVLFWGDAPQTVSGITAEAVYMNGAGGIVLTGNLTITSFLKLDRGNVTIGNNNLLLAGGTTFGSNESHIVTNGTGLVTTYAAYNPIHLPIGPTATTYNPVTIVDNAYRKYSVRVMNSVAPAIADPSRAINRTWLITPLSTSTSSPSIELIYADNEGNANFNPSSPLQMGIHNGTSWSAITSSALTASGNAAKRGLLATTGLSGAFVVTNQGPLQITTAINAVDAEFSKAMILPNVIENRNANIYVNSVRSTNISWQVINSTGQTVMKFDQMLKAGENNITLHTGSLSAGIYQVIGTTSKGSNIKLKFVKQ